MDAMERHTEGKPAFAQSPVWRHLVKGALARDFRPGMQGFIPLSFNASWNQWAS
jgi:hypothetical protein